MTPQDEVSSAGKGVLDILSRLAPGLLLALAAAAIGIYLKIYLLEQRMDLFEAAVTQRFAERETEAKQAGERTDARYDKLVEALDLQREQIAGLRISMEGQTRQIEALTKVIERQQTTRR